VDDLSKQEQQMIEIIRKWTGKNRQLKIEIVDGAWDITLKEIGTKSWAARGTGATFDAAWDNINSTWA
jgi:hypothetical protein